ncbi:SPOR domain-containing protein [Albibacillus kandeliae]|uniref:SPOR domain-containing protein n=1 Tax=Albibacillus kandeliae TaxID=2174228 RepID=UPI001E4B28E7|nr:SPOR domain-containing protein [Albibacillus kandeliae]
MAITALSACSEDNQFSFLQSKPDAETLAGASQKSTKLVERDVEAPEVFSATEAGLWDGRPSLGGVWVAHPEVSDPERVIIRNESNGKFVIGALFRREREIPGPRLQVSSDAAEALGMLAGAPIKLNVTALRREETPAEPAEPVAELSAEAPAEVASAAPVETPKPAPAAAAQQNDDIATAAAAALETSASEAPVAEAAEATVAEAATEPKARKPLFGGKLFGKRNKTVGEPLNALAPAAGEVEPVQASIAAPAVATTAIAQPTAKPAAVTSKLDKPYIQIGIFSVQHNAESTADQMRRAGMVPTVFEQSSNGKTFWRVVVGPAQTSSERSALIKQIKGVGFTDAYAVTN